MKQTKKQLEREIVFLHENGDKVTNLVGSTEDDKGNVTFYELVGMSKEVKGGTKINGRQTFNRLLIRQVFPHIKV